MYLTVGILGRKGLSEAEFPLKITVFSKVCESVNLAEPGWFALNGLPITGATFDIPLEELPFTGIVRLDPHIRVVSHMLIRRQLPYVIGINITKQLDDIVIFRGCLVTYRNEVYWATPSIFNGSSLPRTSAFPTLRYQYAINVRLFTDKIYKIVYVDSVTASRPNPYSKLAYKLALYRITAGDNVWKVHFDIK